MPKKTTVYSCHGYKKTAWLIAIIFSLILVVNNKSFAIKPQPVLKQFTVDEGLLSNEVYHIIQDSIGYIWIATVNGINRFDGMNFYSYKLEDGLIDNTIYEIYTDYKGKIWFISSSGKLTFYENGLIKPFQYNYRITEHLPASRGPIKKSFHVDSLDNVHISLKRFGRIVISKEGTYRKLTGIYNEGVMVVEKLADGAIVSANPLNPNTYDIIYIDKDKNTSYNFDYHELFAVASPITHFFHIPLSDDSFIISADYILFKVVNGEIVHKRKFGSEIIWASIDDEKNLWIAPVEGGIHCYPGANFSQEPSLSILKGVQITSMYKDRENGYWFSSLTHGIFYCPNIKFNNYSIDTELPYDRISTVFVNKCGVYLGYEMAMVSNIYKGKIKNYPLGGRRISGASVRFIGIDSTSTETWIGSSYYLHKIQNNRLIDYGYGEEFWGTYPREIVKDPDGSYWVASVKGLFKFDGKEVVYDSHLDNEFSGLIYSVYQDSSGHIWMGCVNGLWKYENGIYSHLGQENPMFSYQINSIKATADNTLLLATKGIGLILIKGDRISQITQNDGIASNSIKKIFVEPSGVWLATSNGLSWIKSFENGYDIQNINISHGLPTNDVNNVFVRGNEVYVATSKGLTVFNKNNLVLNAVKARCDIKNVKINGIDILQKETLNNLNHNQNFLIFDYIGLSFRNMGRVAYRYRLLGLDSLWVYTKATNAIFSGLSQGKYTFEVQAINSEGIWGDSAKLSVRIKPPYWKKVWFIIFTAIVFSSILFLIYRARIMTIRKRNQIENSINIYKQQSLRQQMNPHFIFNTLNSIQLYILEKDHINSHKYLTKFARLMRMTLDNSQHQNTSLRNEIDALKIYLELESLRLEGKFQYSIEIEDSELLNKKIPTLLIQPFVENAIWHGIMLKPEKDGWVKIIIKSQNGTINCIIEDNGIGRKAAQQINEKRIEEHKSLGYKITAQRIELLNTLFRDKFNISYTDLCSDSGEALGTRVEIKIPYIEIE